MSSITYENLTDTRVTLLIDQAKYFAFRIDNVNAAQMQSKLLDAAADRAAYQLAETADRYVAGLYGGVSTSAPDNTQFTATNFYDKFVDLSVLMDTANLPKEGRYAVVPPWVAGLLHKNSTFITAQSSTVLNGEVGRVAGISILVSNNVPTTGTAPVVYHIMAGVPSAISYAEQIVNIEGLRLEGSFADAVRGLQLYSAKVMDGARLFDLQANQKCWYRWDWEALTERRAGGRTPPIPPPSHSRSLFMSCLLCGGACFFLLVLPGER